MTNKHTARSAPPIPRRPRLPRLCVLVLLTTALALPIAACGKKGSPQSPDENSTYPRQYPAPSTY